LAQIDPKSFDYIRDGNKISRNEDTSIVGYVQDIPGEEPKKFTPKDVIIIKFYSLGEESLGISPVEAAFKASWIRMNLEEALGEAIFRHGHPLYFYKIGTLDWEKEWGQLTPEKIKEWSKYLKRLDTATELTLPWWITPDAISAKSELGDITALLGYFADLVLASFELPRAYVGRGARGMPEIESADLEKTIQNMQEMLSIQLKDQLLNVNIVFEGMPAPSPTKEAMIKFPIHNPTEKLLRARRLGHYANKGLLTRDEDIENSIRLSEELPPLKKKREVTSIDCVFGWGKCKVKENEKKLALDELSSYCKICPKRIRHEKAEDLGMEE